MGWEVGENKHFFSSDLKDKQIIFVKYLFAILLSGQQTFFPNSTKANYFFFHFCDQQIIFSQKISPPPKKKKTDKKCNGALLTIYVEDRYTLR